MVGGGQGDVTAVTYEYGNTFLIVGGLLNTLVVLDALDLARGVKTPMTTHLGVMILFAACVSAVFGTLLRDVPRDQIRLAGRIFAVLVARRLRARLAHVFPVLSVWLWRWAPVAGAAWPPSSSRPSQTAVPDLPAGLSNHTGHFIGYGALGASALRAFARRDVGRRRRAARRSKAVVLRLCLRRHR